MAAAFAPWVSWITKEYKLMKASELIVEISYASGIPNVRWTADILNAANKVGRVDSKTIYAHRDISHIFIFIKENDTVPAYIVISAEKDNGHYTLNRTNNIGQKGLVSLLLAFTIAEAGPLRINNTEPLTSDGLRWIKNIAASPGFSLTNTQGNPISTNTLDQEWITSHRTGDPGPTEIIINVATGIKARIAEHKESAIKGNLFQPAYIFMKQL